LALLPVAGLEVPLVELGAAVGSAVFENIGSILIGTP
jgi:hypothetical protein